MNKLLLSGKNKGKEILLDKEDIDKYSKFKWYIANSLKYVYRNNWTNGKNKLILLHKEIMNSPSFPVDHINRNTLDNRKKNLRICSNAQNCQNRKRDLKYKTSKYHGVYKRKDRKYWLSSIRVNGKLITIGQFNLEKDAAKAYDKFSRKYFGEFGIINFPQKL